VHDLAVVGAGSAGCVLAARLSEDPRRRVLLLEAGGDDGRNEIKIPVAFSKLFKSDVDWNYATVPQPELGGRAMYWPRGKCLGGSSSINATMAIPGHASDYDEWIDGWRYADVAPFYERVLDTLAIEELRDPNPLTRAFVAAATEVGIAPSSLRLTDLEGVRLAPVTQRRGRRRSAVDAYLRPALRRPNLTVVTGAHATRVVCDGRRAVGVEYAKDGERTIAEAGEVVLAGGAVNSPQLLLLSGIGPAEELVRHGIELVHELPGVGANLQDHLAAGILVSSLRPVTLFAAERPLQILRYLLLRRGMLTSNVSEAAAFVRSRPELDAPDLEILFAPVLFEEGGLAPPRAHGFTVGSIALQPRSSGVVRLLSADPFDAPEIDPRYLTDPEDLQTLLAGVELARRIASTQPLASFAGEELEPGDAPVEETLRAKAQTLYHPVGTCRMGSDELAVVDPELRVHGVAGLRVVDASVMPRIPRGHTHLPTLMIAERAAQLIGDSNASRSSTVSRRRISRDSPSATSTAAGRDTAL
jgi:choline dehydrogenase